MASGLLPTQIDAVAENGDSYLLDIVWDLSSIPKEGSSSGEYLLKASLPDGYDLLDGVSALTLLLQLGGVQTFADPLTCITPEPFYIVVQKSISGLSDEQITALKDNLQITVKGNGKSYTLYYGKQDGTTILWRETSPTLWSWRINGVTGDVYNVTETGCAPETIGMPEGSGLTTTGTGTISIAAADIGLGIEEETTCSHKNWPLNEGTFFAGTLTKNRGSVVITSWPPSASQRQAIESALLGGVWKTPVYYYSLSSLNIDTTNQDPDYNLPIAIYNENSLAITTFAYYPNVTYAGESVSGQIVFEATSVWQHVAKVTYNTAAIEIGDIQVTNAYTQQPVELTDALKVSKSLTGRDWQDTDRFTFTITAKDNAPIPENSTVVILGSDTDKTADFGSIQYSETGTYIYTIREDSSNIPGITIDPTTYTVTVTVVDNDGDGLLETSVQYSASKDGEPVNFDYDDTGFMLFENTYSVASTNASLSGHKHLTGATLNREQFSFYIDSVTVDKGKEDEIIYYDFAVAEQNNIPLPTIGLGKSYAIPNGRDDTSSTYMVYFGNLTFEKIHAGHTYTYTIKEVQGDSAGYKYDTDEKEVTYTVSLETDTSDNSQYVDVQVTPDSSTTDVQTHGYFVFDNTYMPLPTSVAPVATKTLVGRDMLDGETFGFTLVPSSQNTEGATIAVNGTTATVSNALQGVAVDFKFGEITFTKAGIYQFFFHETSWNGELIPTTNTEGMTFDTSCHSVTYIVKDVDDQLTVTATNYGSNGSAIVNTYRTSIDVEKVWQDSNDQDGIRPNDITVKLLADRVDTGKTLVLSEGNGWTGSFSDLDVYQNGQRITYTVKEVTVNGYTAEISGDATAGFTITNSHTPNYSNEPEDPDEPSISYPPTIPEDPDEPSISYPPTIPEDPDEPNTSYPPNTPEDSNESEQPQSSKQTENSDTPNDTPQTGDTTNLALYLALLAIAGTGITVTLIFGKKKRYNGKHMR